MFRLRFSDGGELVLTEAGKKKRAGVWLVTAKQLGEDLGHLGPDALELDAAALREILERDRRQLHPLLRDQRAIAGIGRAHANEILLRARLSPFKA
jgi:formamidopyrimidine-DNA glycosylase